METDRFLCAKQVQWAANYSRRHGPCPGPLEIHLNRHPISGFARHIVATVPLAVAAGPAFDARHCARCGMWPGKGIRLTITRNRLLTA